MDTELQKLQSEFANSAYNSKSTAFFRARLPIDYHPKERSLKSEGETGQKVTDWIAVDTLKKISERSVVVEVAGKSAKSRDIFYLTARAFILRSISVQCCFPTDLLYERIGATFGEDIMDRGVLAIDKMGWEKEKFLTNTQAYDLEVFLEKWLNTGRSLILRAETPISANVQWSEEFKSLIKRKTKASFVIG